MSMSTDALIHRLCDNCEPCNRLACPSTRAAIWLALAIPYVAVVAFFVMPGDAFELAVPTGDWRYAAEQAGALGTAIAAAFAAFAATVPGRDRRLLWLPVLPLALWIGAVAYGCAGEGLGAGLQEVAERPDWWCVRSMLMVGAGPAVIMAVMLRRGAPLAPHATVALGGLAAAALANVALRLIFTEETQLMVLVWHVGTVMALTLLAGWAGAWLLSWRAMVAGMRRKLAAG